MTFLIGCASVVAIVAVLIWKISIEVFKHRAVDEEALAGAVKQDPRQKTWSGKTDAPPALMDALPKPEAEIPSAGASKPVDLIAKAPAESVSAPAVSLNNVVPSLPEALAKNEPVPSGIENIDSKRDAISTVLEKFFATNSIEEKAQWVRDPQRVKPLMISYYARAPMPPYRWRGVGKMVRVEEPGYRFGFVQALFEDGSPASLVIEETADGRFLIDWEGLVRYGELSWADFLHMKPVEPKLLRVIATKAEGTPLVAALAPPSSQWLELRHPGESGTVLGYFDLGDPKYAKLVEQLNQGQWKDVPVTLRLCFPTTPSKLEQLSVRIAGVEGKGWLILSESKPNG